VWSIMFESRADDGPVTRPAACPFCKGRIIDTLAKFITESALWRCRLCGETWTIAGLARSTSRLS
jgi:ribosomal protein L37AE/L43A